MVRRSYHITYPSPRGPSTKGALSCTQINDKVLLIVKKRGPYTGMYDLPGGSRENGKTEIETLKREIAEETGCRLVQYDNREEHTVTFDDFVENDGKAGCLVHTGVLFRCRIVGTPDTGISDRDSDGALWVSINDLNEKNASPLVLFCRKRYK